MRPILGVTRHYVLVLAICSNPEVLRWLFSTLPSREIQELPPRCTPSSFLDDTYSRPSFLL